MLLTADPFLCYLLTICSLCTTKGRHREAKSKTMYALKRIVKKIIQTHTHYAPLETVSHNKLPSSNPYTDRTINIQYPLQYTDVYSVKIPFTPLMCTNSIIMNTLNTFRGLNTHSIWIPGTNNMLHMYMNGK